MQIDASLPKDQRILLAAEKVFSTYGFEKSTLDEIIKIADVGKGTVYKYFGSKEQLFYKLVNDKNKPFVEKLKQAIASGDNIESRLLAYFTEMIGFYRANCTLWQIICFEMLGASNGCRVENLGHKRVVLPLYNTEPTEEIKEQVLRYHMILEDEFILLYNLIKEGMASGVLKKGDPEIPTYHLFFGIAMSVFHFSDRKTISDAEAAAISVDRFLHGILIK